MSDLDRKRTYRHTVCDFGAKKSTYDCEVSLYYATEFYLVNYPVPKDFPVTYDFVLAREDEVGNNFFGSVIIHMKLGESGIVYTAYAEAKEATLRTQGYNNQVFIFSYNAWSKDVKLNKLAPEWMKLAAGIALFYLSAPEYYSLGDTKNFNTWMKEWNAAACLGQKIPSSRLRTAISPISPS